VPLRGFAGRLFYLNPQFDSSPCSSVYSELRRSVSSFKPLKSSSLFTKLANLRALDTIPTHNR
jgi:hypothetical protein